MNHDLANAIVARHASRIKNGKSAGDSLAATSKKLRTVRSQTYGDKLRNMSLNDILSQFDDAPLFLHSDNPLREAWFRAGDLLRENHKY
jgi:hypothetical protein